MLSSTHDAANCAILKMEKNISSFFFIFYLKLRKKNQVHFDLYKLFPYIQLFVLITLYSWKIAWKFFWENFLSDPLSLLRLWFEHW